MLDQINEALKSEKNDKNILLQEKIRKDDQYLYLDRYKNPLKIFKVLAQKIGHRSKGDLLDIGAATGEFIYHLERNISNKLTGLEIDARLIKRATKFVSSPIKQGDVLNGNLFSENQFEIITFLNTHMIFDDLRPVLENIKKWSSPGGKIFIFGAFNPDPADIWIRYRISDKPEGNLESGWNIPSITGISNLVTELFGKTSFKWEKFEIDFKIEKDPSDFLRQRTINSGTDYFIINGLCQIVYPYILEIDS